MGKTIHLNTTRMQCISAYIAEPAGKPKGGIVVAQEIFGVNAHIRAVVDRFATHGYTAIAPAFFDHLETGVELGYEVEGVQKGRALIGELGVDIAVEDIASAAGQLHRPERLAVSVIAGAVRSRFSPRRAWDSRRSVTTVRAIHTTFPSHYARRYSFILANAMHRFR